MNIDVAMEYLYPESNTENHKDLDRIKELTKKSPENALSQSLELLVDIQKGGKTDISFHESFALGFITGIQALAASGNPSVILASNILKKIRNERLASAREETPKYSSDNGLN